ncbi:hypothetical protein BGW80DRAFT_1564411 [Lactifluus volemus]|nr:hypothetical protein BGW80DRAFT_1564411 [Lactifluus volemus]
MSILISETSGSHFGAHISFETLTFDTPGADLIIRSRDSFNFRILKVYVIHISSILSERVSKSSDSWSCTPTIAADVEPDVDADSLPVINLSERGAIVFSLLSYIFPVTPILPATTESTMELLSVAQKARLPFIRDETAYDVYSLAQRYGLRKEALQAARSTLTLSPLTIEGLKDELDMMSGACLHELWKYHLRVKSKLRLYLEAFRRSHAKHVLGESKCQSLTPSLIPTWISCHIETMQGNLAFLDPGQFYRAYERHIRDGNRRSVT